MTSCDPLFLYFVFTSLGFLAIGIITASLSLANPHTSSENIPTSLYPPDIQALLPTCVVMWSAGAVNTFLAYVTYQHLQTTTTTMTPLNMNVLYDVHVGSNLGAVMVVALTTHHGREGLAVLGAACWGSVQALSCVCQTSSSPTSRTEKAVRVLLRVISIVIIVYVAVDDSRKGWIPLDTVLSSNALMMLGIFIQNIQQPQPQQQQQPQAPKEQQEDLVVNCSVLIPPPPTSPPPSSSETQTETFPSTYPTLTLDTIEQHTPSQNSLGAPERSPPTPLLQVLDLGSVTLDARSRKGSRVSPRPSSLASTPPSFPKTINWKKGALLGRGAFGEVYVCLNQDDGGMMAVKTVTLDPEDKAIASKLDMLTSEVTILKNFPHTNVVQYYFLEKLDNGINIFMEYVSGGSLHSVIHQFGAISELATVQYAYQTLSGLAHLHHHNIVHADIKCANILVTVDGTIKLADFGASCIAPDKVHLGVAKGTPLWMAPEVLRGEPFGCSADVWSFGCAVLEMLTGVAPWKKVHNDTVAAMGYVAALGDDDEVQLPEGLSAKSGRFLRDVLRPNPVDRLTAKDLLEHDFFFDDGDDDSASGGFHNNNEKSSEKRQIRCSMRDVTTHCSVIF
eukprot:PhF_6_TR23262/c0_g1_i2/m.32697